MPVLNSDSTWRVVFLKASKIAAIDYNYALTYIKRSERAQKPKYFGRRFEEILFRGYPHLKIRFANLSMQPGWVPSVDIPIVFLVVFLHLLKIMDSH